MNRKEVAEELTRMIEEKVGDVHGDGCMGTMLSYDIRVYLDSIGYGPNFGLEDEIEEEHSKWD